MRDARTSGYVGAWPELRGARISAVLWTLLALIAVGMVCVQCSMPDDDDSGPLQLGTGPRIAVPEFSMHITLPPEAAERLTRLGETIVVSVWFDGGGDPLPHAHWEPFRPVYLGDAERELPGAGGTAVFSGVSLPGDDVRRLVDPDYYVSVNLFTGRKSCRWNLIDPAFVQGRISEWKGKVIEVSTRLIDR